MTQLAIVVFSTISCCNFLQQMTYRTKTLGIEARIQIDVWGNCCTSDGVAASNDLAKLLFVPYCDQSRSRLQFFQIRAFLVIRKHTFVEMTWVYFFAIQKCVLKSKSFHYPSEPEFFLSNLSIIPRSLMYHYNRYRVHDIPLALRKLSLGAPHSDTIIYSIIGRKRG